MLGVLVVAGPVDKVGTKDGEVLGLFVDVGPVDGESLGDAETDGSELGCNDGFFDAEGSVEGPPPEGSVEGARLEAALQRTSYVLQWKS